MIWDHLLSQQNIMIVICGSSMSFMEKEVLSEKNPLYVRTTGVLKINELSFDEARAFFGERNSIECHMNYYSIFSGVPYYLSLINSDLSVTENIENNILRNGSVLFNEVEFLLKQELREVHQYNAIIESIALGDTRLNDIYQKTGIEKTKLPYYINSLIDLGIVKKEYPATISIKEQVKSRSGLYRIKNSYFRFYYSFIYPYISELMEGNEAVILEDIIMERLPMFTAMEFKKYVISYTRQLGINKQLPIRPVKIGRWWQKGEEIDIVAYDVKGNYLFGKCKWRNEKVTIKVYKDLKKKVQRFPKTFEEAYYIIFSKAGFKDELLKEAETNDQLILVDFSKL